MSSNKLNLHIRYAFPSSDISVENNTEAMRPVIEHPKLLQWGTETNVACKQDHFYSLLLLCFLIIFQMPDQIIFPFM